MKIQTRILLLLSLGVVIPLLISHFFSYRVYARELHRHADTALIAQSRQTAEALNSRLAWMLETALMVLHSIPFENFTSEELPEALSIPHRQLTFANVVILLDSAGRAIVSPYRLTPDIAQAYPDRSVLDDAELQRFSRHIPLQLALSVPIAVGPVYYSEHGAPRIAMASSQELMSGDKWVVAVGVELDALCQMLGEFAQMNRMRLSLFNDKGQSICTPEAARSAAAPEGLSAAHVDQVVAVERDGESLMAVVSDVPLTGWRVYGEIPSAHLFAKFDSVLQVLVLWVLVSFLLALAAGIVLSRGITAPIAALLTASRRVSEGDYSERIAIQSQDEIGELSTSFNRMTEEIQRWNRELQARVDRNTRELREAQEQIVHTQKLAAVGELGAGVAHEINNPLTAVLGNAQLALSMAGQDAALRPSLEDIVTNARRVAEVVDGLLRFSQKQWDESMEPLQPHILWGSVLALNEQRIEDAGVQVVWLRQEAVTISAARGHLQMAFSHLLDNALHSMGEGGKITLETAQVEGGAVMVSIADTGEGMSEAVRLRAMEPFFTTRSPGSGAAGMGLAMVYRVSVAHGARMLIHSKLGEGTRVTLYFPGVLKTSRQ
ncbi:MAG: HAMP domain-containing histidine kinase [Myxococcales bacterium]|nr:HAMP domain-containing histidine kinase [Myxococcales bacterium]